MDGGLWMWLDRFGDLATGPLVVGFLYHVIECSKKRGDIYDKLEELGKSIAEITGYLKGKKGGE